MNNTNILRPKFYKEEYAIDGPLLLNSDVLFMHIPKTGGTWVIQTLTKLGIKFEEIGIPHAFRDHTINYLARLNINPKFIFSFIRHPATWLKSYWAFRRPSIHQQIGKWIPFHINSPLRMLDICSSIDFNKFVNNSIDIYGDPISQIFKNYINNIDYIGHQESLSIDLTTALKMANIDFNQNIIDHMSTQLINITIATYKRKTIYTKQTLDRLREREHRLIQEFYPNYDYSGLC